MFSFSPPNKREATPSSSQSSGEDLSSSRYCSGGEFTEATRLKSPNTQRQREVMSTEPEFLCPQWPSSHLIYLTLVVSKQRGSSAAPESPPGPNIYSVVQMIPNPPHSCAITARLEFKTPAAQYQIPITVITIIRGCAWLSDYKLHYWKKIVSQHTGDSEVVSDGNDEL